MLLGRRGNGAWQLRCCLATCFAVLLALAPFARPSLPLHLAAPAAGAPEALTPPGDLDHDQPAAGLRPAQPATLGVLSRLSLVESALGLPPLKPALLRTAAERILPARGAAPARRDAARGVFERSAVGTARTPTGPPA